MSKTILYNKELLFGLIVDSLKELYKKDYYLINNCPMDAETDGKHYVGERTIVFRFAHYLLSNIEKINVNPDLSLDCEYGRNGWLEKTLPQYPNGVIPDIIIHKRGNNEKNILVMEFKTYWNNNQDRDEDKIKKFIDKHGEYKYKFGATVLIKDEEAILNIFEYGKENEEIKIPKLSYQNENNRNGI